MASRSPKRTRSTWTNRLMAGETDLTRRVVDGPVRERASEPAARGKKPGEVSVRGFSLTVDQLAPDVLRVVLRGDLDLSRALLVDSELKAIEALRPAALVLDLRELDFVDSSGVGRLLGARRRAMRGAWQLLVVRGGAAVQRIMSLAAVDRVLRFIDEPGEALAAVAPA